MIPRDKFEDHPCILLVIFYTVIRCVGSRDKWVELVSRQRRQLTKCQGLAATPSSGCAAPLVACTSLAVEILVSQPPVWFNSMHQRIISNTHFSFIHWSSTGCHASTKQRLPFCKQKQQELAVNPKLLVAAHWTEWIGRKIQSAKHTDCQVNCKLQLVTLPFLFPVSCWRDQSLLMEGTGSSMIRETSSTWSEKPVKTQSTQMLFHTTRTSSPMLFSTHTKYKHANPNKQDVSFYSQAHNLQVGHTNAR